MALKFLTIFSIFSALMLIILKCQIEYYKAHQIDYINNSAIDISTALLAVFCIGFIISSIWWIWS